MTLPSFSGYGLPETQVGLINALVLEILRRDVAIKQAILGNSAALASSVSDETGTGVLVFANSPVFVTRIDVPNLRLRNATTAAVVGNATLVAGSSGAISLTQATASSYVLLQRKTAGGTIGDLTYTLGAGTLTITSANAADTSTVTWALLNGY